MTHASKVHSKRRDGRVSIQQASARQSVKRSPSDYSDAFLRDWIDERLGRTEIRPLLLLHVDCSSANREVVDVAEVIEAHGGHAMRRRGNQFIGAWGLAQCDQNDRQRAICAALDIRQGSLPASEGTCLLHLKKVGVVKGDAQSNDDAIVLALTETIENRRDAASLSGTVLLTEAFKEACQLQTDLLPVAAPTTRSGSIAPTLFALNPADSRIGQQSMPRANGPLAWASEIDAIGDLKPLIVAAAIVGRIFALQLLSRMLGMERQRLREAVAVAKAMQLFDEDPSSSVERFFFVNEELQRFAYGMVPPKERLRVHRHLAEILSQSPADALASPPDQVARHHRIAENQVQSRRWLSKAAWQAITNDDAGRAVALLEKALQNDNDPATVSASKRSLVQLLGVQLALVKGNGSDAVVEACQRSIATTDQLPYLAWRQELRSLWLAQSSHLVKGEVRAALTLGDLLLIHLRRQNVQSARTVGKRILVNRLRALSLMLSGRLCAALEHYDKVICDYDEGWHARLRFAYGSDQLALAHAHRAWTFALARRFDEVPLAVAEARRVSERLDHPHTTAHAMSVIAIAWLSSGAYEEALFAAREARAVAQEFRFPYWIAWADVMLAAVVAYEKPHIAYKRLEAAMSAYRATDAAQLCPFIHALLSAAALRTGQPEVALQHADAGLAMISQNGCILHRPKLQRRRARALFAMRRPAEADAALQAGYSDADKFGAALFKLAIARDGLRHTVNQQQISWQSRYHAAV